ncbi:hypothetical protein A3K87_09840 [Variovorax paradoxus]|uniref:Uncharacterized protein n=1 Tax=Variovorax paradoxus TaxID=34073 RepID=A0AA91ICA9_VARPD|nr:hypothetical protein [Variovorax paradoxus]OAK66057.1 hypothetical protein A3K87_09840 [Variovorax paradoxus]
MHPCVSESAPPPTALMAAPAANAQSGTITITPATPRLRALQRRLAKWEIAHLRQHAADLAERLEAAEQRATEAERRLSDAEYACDLWHDQAVDAHKAAADAAGGVPGITMSGQFVVVPAGAGGLHA